MLEQLRPSDELVDELLQHPELLKQYFKIAHELVALLAAHPEVFQQLPAAISLVNRLLRLQKELPSQQKNPVYFRARDLLKTLDDLHELRAIKQQMTLQRQGVDTTGGMKRSSWAGPLTRGVKPTEYKLRRHTHAV